MMEYKFLNEFRGAGSLVTYPERKAAVFLAAEAERQFYQRT